MKWEVDHVHMCWPLIANAIDGLERIEVLPPNTVARVAHEIAVRRQCRVAKIRHEALDYAIELCGRMEALRGEEWLRQTYQQRVVPRRKPPPPTALQCRVEQATSAKSIVIEADHQRKNYRVTVVTTQGDVVSCRGERFAWTLDGALRMASTSHHAHQTKPTEPEGE